MPVSYTPLDVYTSQSGFSCVPTTAKIVQKVASSANAGAIVMPQALGANLCGVITTAIIAATYVALLR